MAVSLLCLAGVGCDVCCYDLSGSWCLMVGGLCLCLWVVTI